MFAQLKSLLDLIRSATAEFRQFKTAEEREKNIVRLLETYFLLKDCVDDGAALIADAGPDPVGKIGAMSVGDAEVTLRVWDRTLWKQGRRLYRLQDYLFGQSHLAVIDPELQQRIGKIVGYKMDRAVTLQGIGAALFFRNMFPMTRSNEEKAEYVSIMAGARNSKIDMEKTSSEIASLRESLDQYRAVVERFASNDEILRLSRQARSATFFPREED